MKVLSGKAITLIITLCSTFGSTHAQFYTTPRHELGFSVGMFTYLGDLTPERFGAFKSPGFAFNLFYNHILSRSFSLRTNLAHGNLRADETNYADPEWRQQRAFRFKARTTEISEQLVWNILGNGYSDRKMISPYIFGGIGISSLRVTRDWRRFNYDYFIAEPTLLEGLGADTLTKLPGTIAVLPVGGGLRYPITNNLSVMIEASYRFTFNDYIDGFSKAANAGSKDHYSNYTLGIIYTFGRNSSLGCPPMKY